MTITHKLALSAEDLSSRKNKNHKLSNLIFKTMILLISMMLTLIIRNIESQETPKTEMNIKIQMRSNAFLKKFPIFFP